MKENKVLTVRAYDLMKTFVALAEPSCSLKFVFWDKVYKYLMSVWIGELEHNVNDKNLLVEVDTTDILNYYNYIVTGDILSPVLRRALFCSSGANIINLVLNPI